MRVNLLSVLGYGEYQLDSVSLNIAHILIGKTCSCGSSSRYTRSAKGGRFESGIFIAAEC